jgi:hypothetical protein
MKSPTRFGQLLLSVALVASLWSCSNSGGAKEVGSTLYQQVGGSSGLANLANQFGANISANPQLTAVIDAVTLSALKSGLTNDVMKASGMQPAGPETLASALQGKSLDASGLNALSNALAEAGSSVGLDSGTISSLTALLKPAGQSMMGLK